MKIVLAYSGGLDTSVILRWLKDNYDAEIIAFCADIGQEEELAGLEKKPLTTGASKCAIDDLRGPIFLGNEYCPSADRETNGRDRAGRKSGCDCARRDRQRKRSGPV